MTMNKTLMFLITVLCFAFTLVSTPDANTKPDLVKMQRHVDKVKITHPATYQDMLVKAGGIIEDCTSCHGDMKTKKLPSEYRYPRSPRR
jgi:hypothetical protein